MGAILDFVTGPSFVNISYTRPCPAPYIDCPLNANPVIGIGLDITQSFVNLALVVVLVFIAVSIVLKLGEENAKKALARLIIVALLVNFAPVICGLIVDPANIIMNYFLVGIREGISGILAQVTTWGSGFMSILSRLTTLSGQATIIAQSLVQIILNYAIAFAFFLFTALFILRYLAIWILVILSPLAFVFWILPATKKYWDMWWSNLIQWSIIGIPAAFFLYLGARVYEVLPSVYTTKLEMPGIEPAITGYLDQVFPFFIVVVFLLIGFIVGLQTSAMGATAAISLAKKGWATTGKWTGRKIWGGIKPWAEEKAHVREAAGAITRGWERVPVGRWFLPEKFRTYGEFRPAIEAAREKVKPYSSKEIAYRQAIGADYGVKAVAGMAELTERADMQDLVTAYKEKYYGKDWEKKGKTDTDLFKNEDFSKEMGRRLQIAQAGGRHNTLLRGDPRFARAAAGKIVGYEKLTKAQAVRKAVSEARAPHIAHWEREVLKDKDVVEGGMERGRDFWENAQRQVKKGQETSLWTIDNSFSEFIDKAGISPPKTDKETGEVWKQFREDFKKGHEGREGYFSYLDSPRAKEQGWRIGQYVPKDKRGEEPPEKPGPVTLGEAVGIKPTSPRVERLRKREEEIRKKARERVERLRKRGEK